MAPSMHRAGRQQQQLQEEWEGEASGRVGAWAVRGVTCSDFMHPSAYKFFGGSWGRWGSRLGLNWAWATSGHRSLWPLWSWPRRIGTLRGSQRRRGEGRRFLNQRLPVLGWSAVTNVQFDGLADIIDLEYPMFAENRCWPSETVVM